MTDALALLYSFYYLKQLFRIFFEACQVAKPTLIICRTITNRASHLSFWDGKKSLVCFQFFSSLIYHGVGVYGKFVSKHRHRSGASAKKLSRYRSVHIELQEEVPRSMMLRGFDRLFGNLMPYYIDPIISEIVRKPRLPRILSRIWISEIEFSLGDILQSLFPGMKNLIDIKVKIEKEPARTIEEIRKADTPSLKKILELFQSLERRDRALSRIETRWYEAAAPNSTPDESLLSISGVLSRVERLQSWKGIATSPGRVCTHVIADYPANMMLFDDPFVPLVFGQGVANVIKLEWHPHIEALGLLRRDTECYLDVLMLLDKTRPEIAGKAHEFAEWADGNLKQVKNFLGICQKKEWRKIDSGYWMGAWLDVFKGIVGTKPMRCSVLQDVAYDTMVLKLIYQLHNLNLEGKEIRGNLELEDLGSKISELQKNLLDVRQCLTSNKIVTRIPVSFS